jgi:hypothetical protein
MLQPLNADPDLEDVRERKKLNVVNPDEVVVQDGK